MAQYSGNIIPTMTSNTTPTPLVVSSSTQYSTTFAPWKAFDGSSATHWMTPSGTLQGWVKIDLGSQRKIGRYSLSSSTDTGNLPVTANPKNWTFEGSNTGLFSGEQDTLHTVTNEQAWTQGLKRIYDFDNQKSYRYYRIYISINQGYANFMGFAELEVMEVVYENKFLISSEEKYYSVRSESYSQDTVIPTMSNNITPLGKAFSSSEYSTDRGAWRSFDKTQTTYASRDGAGMIGHLGYEFDIAIAIGKYSVQSGTADSSTLQALPKDWTFESSDDGVNWNVLDTQTNQAWTSAYTDKEYYIDKRKIGKYKMYRLNWSTTNGWRYAIVGELKMYQYTSSLVRELSHALDVNFIKYGMNKNDTIDLNHSVSNIQHVVEDIQSLGPGKVFKQKIDTTKIPIKKASIT